MSQLLQFLSQGQPVKPVFFAFRRFLAGERCAQFFDFARQGNPEERTFRRKLPR
jgi:hypothetical protein